MDANSVANAGASTSSDTVDEIMSKEEVNARMVAMNNMEIDMIPDDEIEEFQQMIDGIEIFEMGNYFTLNLFDELPLDIKEEK